MKSIKKCNICGGNKFDRLFKEHDRMYSIDGAYTVCMCTNCSLMFLNPQPSPAELAKHYPPDEYTSLQGEGGKSYIQVLLDKTYLSAGGGVFAKLLFLPLKPLQRSRKIVTGGKILDVGCGSGHFLAWMNTWDMECYGVEPHKFNREFAKKNKLNIRKGTLEDGKFQNEMFEVITMNHVLEHLPDPSRTMNELFRILKPGGTLIVGIPQKDSLPFKLFGQDWVLLDVPRHLYTFSTKLMHQMAKKTGFHLERVRYNAVPAHLLSSILYWSNKYRNKPVLYSQSKFIRSRLLFFVFLPLTYIMNFFRLGDRAEFFFIKPTSRGVK